MYHMYYFAALQQFCKTHTLLQYNIVTYMFFAYCGETKQKFYRIQIFIINACKIFKGY